MTKFCTNCKHQILDSAYYRCALIEVPLTPSDLANGLVTPKTYFTDLWSCRSQREVGWLFSRLFNRCGKEARWWEPKA